MDSERQLQHWDTLFRPGTRVVAIPNWQRPRLLVPADSASEAWEGSRFYPAYRWTGRLYRSWLRVRAVAGIGAARASRGDSYDALRAFLADVAPDAIPSAVQVGMPGLAQKLTVKLTDPAGRVLGFLKCAEQELARWRLRHEHEMLRRLPAGAGPAVLKYGALGPLDVLLLAPVIGRHPAPAVAPSPTLLRFVESLVTDTSHALEHHPWFASLGGDAPSIVAHLDALAARRWPVALRHGDLAPWNLIGTNGGGLVAIDWEYGTECGLPGLDIAQYVLQVALLIVRWRPEAARRYAAEALETTSGLGLTKRESVALVALAAHATYCTASREGIADDDARQAWRRVVWQAPT